MNYAVIAVAPCHNSQTCLRNLADGTDCAGCLGGGVRMDFMGGLRYVRPIQGGGCRGGEWVETRAPRVR